MGEKWWASIHYVEPRGFAEELDETCVRERGIGVMPSFGAQTTGRMQLSFTEIRKSVRREDLEEKLRVLFWIHYSKCLLTSEWKIWVVVRLESEVQGRGHAWR